MKQLFIEPIKYYRESKRNDMIPAWRSQRVNVDSPYRTVTVPCRNVLTVMVPYIMVPDKSEKYRKVDKYIVRDRERDRDRDEDREPNRDREAHTKGERERVRV